MIGKGKAEVKKEWERSRDGVMKAGLLGVSDACIMGGRVGVGGVL